jgi:ribosomal protein L6P/L9E
VGFSHEINIAIPLNIKVNCPNTTNILITGQEYERVSSFAQKIIAIKPAKKDKYKNKGVELNK